MLAPSCHEPSSPPPNCLFPPTVTHPTDCIYSQKRFTLTYSCIFSFLPHSFNCFLRVIMPTLIYPQTLPLTPALTPLLRTDPGNGLLWTLWCAEEQHGVMWTRPGEAQLGGSILPELLSDVSLSAQRFSAFNLRNTTVHCSFPVCSRWWERTRWDEADYRGGGPGWSEEQGAVGWPSTSTYKRRKSKLIV